jgi:hypothetical protein
VEYGVYHLTLLLSERLETQSDLSAQQNIWSKTAPEATLGIYYYPIKRNEVELINVKC